jgi:Xaa-Pro dipeptidase
VGVSRRRFTQLFAGALGGAALADACRPSSTAAAAAAGPDECGAPAEILALQPLPGRPPAITAAERERRLATARQLMNEQGLDALLVESGSSLHYFTGVDWWPSERTFAFILPARGEPAWVCPAFEEARARELIAGAPDVRIWQEDESPFALVAGILRDRGASTGAVGVEERVRFFILDGVRTELPAARFVSGTPVSAGCRMIKSPAELALMQHANDITVAAFKATFASLREGMSHEDIVRNMRVAMTQLGGSDADGLVGLGKYSAFPHGSIAPQALREGDVVLIDCGCTVEHYTSDITRTSVFGKPTQRQRDIWELERRAQDAAIAAVRPGVPCEAVDAAARKVLTDAGFGPGYQVPGLPHRTGHGIGLDGHEWTYLVKGNTTPLQPGMCFSDEPTIVIYGEFGIRLEDCFHVTGEGGKFFSPQSEAVDRPV